MTLGSRLRRLRELAGLSQNELAKRARVPRPTITDVENDRQRNVTLETARRLARVLGVTLDYLAGKGEDEEDQAPRRSGASLEEIAAWQRCVTGAAAR
jgi:transcriptional regulator with XRE-family HTH domain